MNQQILRTDQYRDICKGPLQVERNLRIGKFKKSIYGFGVKESRRLTMSDDKMAWVMYSEYRADDISFRSKLLDTESMDLKEIPVPPSNNYKVVDGALITVKRNVDGNGQLFLKISDPNNLYLINVTDDYDLILSRKCYDASIRYKIFVTCNFIGNGNHSFHTVHRIKIWKLINPSTLLKTFTHKRLARV